jgi:hypothetical protein
LLLLEPVFGSAEERQALHAQLEELSRALDALDRFVTEAGGGLPATTFEPLGGEASW